MTPATTTPTDATIIDRDRDGIIRGALPPAINARPAMKPPTRPPRCPALSMLVWPKPLNMLNSTTTTAPLRRDALTLGGSVVCRSRRNANRLPYRPKIAPDAPTPTVTGCHHSL